MNKKGTRKKSKTKLSRRNFLTTIGTASAGVIFNPFRKSDNLYASTSQRISESSATVAITRAYDYDRNTIKQKVQHLFEELGGINDIIGAGNKVAIKINLTGGVIALSVPGGVDVRESVWTHPEVLRAVGELIIDCGVNAQDLYIVEALPDASSYETYGYSDVQQNLGAQLIDLNNQAPYSDFIDKEVGENHFYYSSFKLNQILADIDVFVSIPKMKQHSAAGVTHTMKNLIGITPFQHYVQSANDGYRTALHFDGGDIRTDLPRSILDLNMARPIHLGVIDGIKNSEGGEGPWNPTFSTSEYNLLMAGKDPVALDSIASFLMGNDPEAEKFQLPGGGECDNYLRLAQQVGMGTNVMNEIEIVGDGADAVPTYIKKPYQPGMPDRILFFQNYPNPFHTSTTIRYYLPKSENISIKILNSAGQEIEIIIKGLVNAGEHYLQWSLKDRPAGIYFCKLEAGKHSEVIKLVFYK